MPRPLTKEVILALGPTLLDGGFATELQRRGAVPHECLDAWNLSRPEHVSEVIREYVAAGSGIVLTNTFRSHALGLAAFGLSKEVARINRRAAELARDAAAEEAWVFGSIGPAGACVARGEVSEQAVFDAVAEQARALEQAGVDGLVLETFSDALEVTAALHALGSSVSIPYGVSITFDPGRTEAAGGMTPEALSEVARSEGAAFVGANCGIALEAQLGVAERLAGALLPVWMKPSAGLPLRAGAELRYALEPATFAAYAPRFIAAGVRFLGGCCGTGPAFIRALRGALEE